MIGRRELLSFCLVLFLAGTLRFSGMCFDSLWLDEGYQSLAGACGQGPHDFVGDCPEKYIFRFDRVSEPHQMLAEFRKVDPLCPPLYALMLNRWMACSGNTDFLLRSLSATISVASVALLMIMSSALLGPSAAIFAGLLQAVSPFDIHYAQEARMYSLVVFNSLLSAGTVLLILKSALASSVETSEACPEGQSSAPVNAAPGFLRGKPAIFFLLSLHSVSTWALINSHYTGLFLAAAEGLSVSIFLFCRRDWKLLFLFAISWLFAGLLWIPWLPMFLKSAGSRKESFYVSRAFDFIWPLKALFIRIPVNWLIFMSGQRVTAYAAGIYVSSALMLASAVKLLKDSFRGPSTSQRSVSSSTGSGQEQAPERIPADRFLLSALWLWALLPALILWLIDVIENHRVVEVPRYVIFSSPAVYLLAACGLLRLKGQGRKLAILLGLHLVFAGANLIYTHTVKQREPWREMAAAVERLVGVDELLVVSQPYDIACLDRYLSRARLQMGMSPAMGTEVVQSRLRSFNSFALLTAQEGESIEKMISPEFKLISRVDMSHGLHLRLYRR